MKYGYFPGCSLERNAASYHTSTLAVSKPLDLELVEIDDWNCCGATEYVSLDLTASYALIARNLAQANKTGASKQLVAPCSACYLNLRKCDKYMGESASLAGKVNQALAAGGLSYKPGDIKVRHLLDVIVNDVGYEAVEAKVTKPLQGLKVAPYYGCMIVRPEFNGKETAFDSTEQPLTLDYLLESLGAEVVDFSVKAQCCGGHMTQISEASGFDMIRRIVKAAADQEADVIVALCPMCQLNLDAFQGSMNNHFKTNYNVPILYFTQLMGLAFGMDPAALGIGSELVDPRPALAKIGRKCETTEGEKPAKPRKDDKSLPMPKIVKPARPQRQEVNS
jgi:heterodisulfide reductase subunit B2